MFRFYRIFFFILLLSTLFSSAARAGDNPNLTAKSWLITDAEGKILEGENITDVRSIASITKLMTVLVTIDSGVSLSEPINKRLYNKTVTRQDLIELSMIKSDNTAAKMLCDTYPTGYENCIRDMNIKAVELGMYYTHFVEPTGLYNENVSTAFDLVKLVLAAKNYPLIVEVSNINRIVWSVQRKIYFYNTNSLVGKDSKFFVSKTGWIRNSGGCIVMMLDTLNGVRTVILLGSKSTKTRIPEAHLLSQLF